jgi:hypothetical protein
VTGISEDRKRGQVGEAHNDLRTSHGTPNYCSTTAVMSNVSSDLIWEITREYTYVRRRY